MNFNPSVRGPDVSFHQDAPTTPQQIDFAKMKAAGASFVIIRAGQNAWADPDLSYNLLEARKAGLPVGVYFFYDSRVSPESQADLFLSLTRGIPLELGMWLDLEENYGGSYRGWQNWKKCLMRLRASGQDVGVYTAPAYWMRNRPTGSADLAYFKSFPLWIAHYDVSAPIIPSPWDYAILWQMGTPAAGLEYGAESLEIDMNYWYGSPESFRAYFGLGIDEPEEPGEPTMARYEATALGDNTRLRSTHDTTWAYIGNYPRGTKFHGDEVWTATATTSTSTGTIINQQGDEWLRVTDVSGALASGWVAIKHKGLDICTLTETNPPTEPPTEPAEYVADFDVTLTAPDGKRYAGTVQGLTLREVL
jgi:lysozyme